MLRANNSVKSISYLSRRKKLIGEEKKTICQEKWLKWLYRGREEGGRLDGDGSTTPEKIWTNIKLHLTWVNTDNTGRWWWRLAHKDVETVFKLRRNCHICLWQTLSSVVPVSSDINNLTMEIKIRVVTWSFVVAVSRPGCPVFFRLLLRCLRQQMYLNMQHTRLSTEAGSSRNF